MKITAYVSLASYIPNAPGAAALRIHKNNQLEHEEILTYSKTNPNLLAETVYKYITNYCKDYSGNIEFHSCDHIFVNTVEDAETHKHTLHYYGTHQILEQLYNKARGAM